MPPNSRLQQLVPADLEQDANISGRARAAATTQRADPGSPMLLFHEARSRERAGDDAADVDRATPR
ncbi:MAG TPA: hypothetical protein VF957_17545, partial [Bradyrhizobium sp.]